MAPEIGDCPTDLVLECGEDYATTINDWLTAAEANLLATSTDDCGAAGLTVSNDYDGVTIPDPSCDLSAGLTVTFTVTDACGNESTCTSTIFLDDTLAPEIGDCPTDLVLECGEDYATTINDWLTAAEANLLATSTDDCGAAGLTVSNDYDGVTIPDPSCDLSAGLTVTFTVTDACGNESTCTSTIFLDDTLAPEIGDCPTDLVLECGEDYATTINDWLTAAEAKPVGHFHR